MLHISYLYRIHTVPFLLFRAYNTGNQLIMHSISGLRDGEVCSLYSLSGSKLDQATAANGSVSLCAKGQSVVVVRIGSQNMKMIIK